MSVLLERQGELEKLVKYANTERQVPQLGIDYQTAALDLSIAAHKMLIVVQKRILRGE